MRFFGSKLIVLNVLNSVLNRIYVNLKKYYLFLYNFVTAISATRMTHKRTREIIPTKSKTKNRATNIAAGTIDKSAVCQTLKRLHFFEISTEINTIATITNAKRSLAVLCSSAIFSLKVTLAE